MGCGGSKASPPQASTTEKTEKTLLAATGTASDINPSTEPQKDAVTKTSGEDPGPDTQKTVAAVEETVQEQSNEPQKDTVTKTNGEDPGPDAEKTVAAVEETVQEPSNELQKDAVSKTNGEDPGPDAQETVSAVEETVQEPAGPTTVQLANQDDTSVQAASGPSESIPPTSGEETSGLGSDGKNATSLHAVKDATPAGLADSPRKDTTCGFCCC